jgi:hypothetical protein
MAAFRRRPAPSSKAPCLVSRSSRSVTQPSVWKWLPDPENRVARCAAVGSSKLEEPAAQDGCAVYERVMLVLAVSGSKLGTSLPPSSSEAIAGCGLVFHDGCTEIRKPSCLYLRSAAPNNAGARLRARHRILGFRACGRAHAVPRVPRSRVLEAPEKRALAPVPAAPRGARRKGFHRHGAPTARPRWANC